MELKYSSKLGFELHRNTRGDRTQINFQTILNKIANSKRLIEILIGLSEPSIIQDEFYL